MKTVRASEFATVMGIADRTAREVFRLCALGKTWRNISLPMVELEGEAGGVSGKVRCVVVDALPPELRAKFEPRSKAIETPLQTLFEEGKTGDASALACWRWSIIRDVYGMPSGPDKTAEIARIAHQTHHFQGADVG